MANPAPILCIDAGNSHFKVGLFDASGTLTHLDHLEEETKVLKLVSGVAGAYPTVLVGISNVRNLDLSAWYATAEASKIEYRFIGPEIKLPYTLRYRTPGTLGADRMAAVAGARVLVPEGHVMVADIGTAITTDILDADNNYLGGTISPGQDMRLKSLHEHTVRLPHVAVASAPELPGTSTETSLQAGVFWGIVGELNQLVEEYRFRLHQDLHLVLTGGDAAAFENHVKSVNFADPHIILRGIHALVGFNAYA